MGHRLLRRRSHHPSDDDQHFDTWSRTYDRSPAQVLFFGPVHQAVPAALAGRLAAGRLLDIGTGTGRLLDRLGQGRPGLALFGLDRSAGMLSAARQARAQLNLVLGTAEALPFANESFDVVTTTLSFHHWSDQPKALSEVRRVLRPGGAFALADVSSDDLPRWGPVRAVARNMLAHGLPLEERHRLLQVAGLRVVEERRAFHRRWIPLTVAERVSDQTALQKVPFSSDPLSVRSISTSDADGSSSRGL
ncbi:MAG: class I SAM-dependent methyltransferase [Acidimicrobiales bacterium]|jgi:ubiquinone/menaquinone biosynthesis C-methylase UbiE